MLLSQSDLISKFDPAFPFKTPLMIRLCLFCFLMCIAVSLPCLSQNYNEIDWGTYFSDTINHPSFNYSHDDWCTQIKADSSEPVSIYVSGKTKAATNKTITFCNGSHNIKLGSAAGFLAKYDDCGTLKWSVYFGDYAYCLGLDEEDGRKIRIAYYF